MTGLAVLVAKLASWASRTFTKGGATSLPGLLALKLDSNLISKLGKRLDGRIVVTGTNGKTTTSRFISESLAKADRRVVHNQAGANLVRGISTVLATKSRQLKGAWGLFEVDEASMPTACAELQPDIVVVTNLFRDQLDRYGELKRTAEYIKAGLAVLPEKSVVLLNADDPLVASLGKDLPQDVHYFGLEDDSVGTKELPRAADNLADPDTGKLLEYDRVYVGHLGHYRGLPRPKPDTFASDIDLDGIEGSQCTLHTGKTEQSIQLKLPGLYNIYNAAAAMAASTAAGVTPEQAAQAMAETSAAFGRLEKIKVGDKQVFLGLIKNPVGANEVLNTLALDGAKKHFLILINDNFADGQDVSWLWDADFENLLPVAASVTVGGKRGPDMALRLKYAGFEESAIHIGENLEEALKHGLEQVQPGETLYVLPTYTAMLELRHELSESGHLEHYLS